MKENRRLFAAAAAYTVLLVLIATYYIVKGNPNYLNYKRYLSSLPQEKVSSGSVNTGTKKNSDDKAQQTSGNAENTSTGANNTVSEQNQGGQASPATGDASKTDTPASQDKNYQDVQFTRVLRSGMQGDDVKKLQYLLTTKKLYTGSISGTFDEKTLQAVKKFQSQNKLFADGVLGSGTWVKLQQ